MERYALDGILWLLFGWFAVTAACNLLLTFTSEDEDNAWYLLCTAFYGAISWVLWVAAMRFLP